MKLGQRKEKNTVLNRNKNIIENTKVKVSDQRSTKVMKLHKNIKQQHEN